MKPGQARRSSSPGSGSSSCRSGCRARARPSAASPSRSRRRSECGCVAGGGTLVYLAVNALSWLAYMNSREAGVQFAQPRPPVGVACSATSKPSATYAAAWAFVSGDCRDRCTRCRARTPRATTEQPAGLSRLVLVEAAGGAADGVVVAGHDDRGLLAARQVPEARQRLAVAAHRHDQVREQALLLVGLRDRDLGRVEPVRLDVAGAARRRRGRSGRIGKSPSRSCPTHAGLPWRV